jgi:thiamine-monophosphate kinase
MSELEILERLRARVRLFPRSGVRLGIGDDCAIFSARAGEELLITTDLLLEGVHFERGSHPPATLGRKALARALSDIAAMGGRARFCLVSLAAPRWAGRRFIDGFFRGLLALASRYKVTLAGGDLTQSDALACDVVVCGAVERGGALTRSGARAGDLIYVSGALGGSALGLKTQRGAAWRRHRTPEPRLELGACLRRLGATAAIDVSDGLALDLYRLAKASGLAASLHLPLPVFPGASLEEVLHGGEDYELLFTVPPGVRIPGAHAGVPLTPIGRMRAGRPGALELFGRPLAPRGWDPFQLYDRRPGLP